MIASEVKTESNAIEEIDAPVRSLPSAEVRNAMVEIIAARCDVEAIRGRSFAEMTSLRVGGMVDWTLVPKTEAAAACVVHRLDKAHVLWRVLGAGSNVLADDGEHHYVVVQMRELKGTAEFDGTRVSVSAGYSLPRLCVDAARRGLSGIEGLGGIPGTIGGALWMNAGAYGNEIGGVVESVRVARGGEVVIVDAKEIGWYYRRTSFKAGDLLLGATLNLREDDKQEIERRMNEAKRQRLTTQPHGGRSAGCFFKNPATGGSTGRMIDELGLKGTRRGGAIVSPVHANFIVTEGKDATATDTLALAEEIRQRVQQEHGVELEYEVELWKGSTIKATQDSAIAATSETMKRETNETREVIDVDKEPADKGEEN